MKREERERLCVREMGRVRKEVKDEKMGGGSQGKEECFANECNRLGDSAKRGSKEVR